MSTNSSGRPDDIIRAFVASLGISSVRDGDALTGSALNRKSGVIARKDVIAVAGGITATRGRAFRSSTCGAGYSIPSCC
jgi:hypothetical protein